MPSSILWRVAATCLTLLAISFCGGCAAGPNKLDPWEKTNRFFYQLDDGLDRVAIKPLADGYVKVVPLPIRTGLGNGFDNLGYFNTIINDFLQGKWPQGFSDSGRMLLNSSAGMFGFFDVATPMGLPSHDNDFGITLGVWGAAQGPYLVLPLFGPSTVRDAPGIGVGFLTDPTTWLDLPLKISIPLNLVEAMDARSRAERAFRFRNAAAIDSYAFTRDAYLQYREAQVHPVPATGPSVYDEDNGPATEPATQPTPATAPATSPAH
jgi:phospholipid-binding lipoprotein MlaA